MCSRKRYTYSLLSLSLSHCDCDEGGKEVTEFCQNTSRKAAIWKAKKEMEGYH